MNKFGVEKILFKDRDTCLLLINELEGKMSEIKYRTCSLKTSKKKWKYQFHIGRTVTRFVKSVNVNCVNHPTQKNKMINISNVEMRELCKKKNLILLSKRPTSSM